MRIAEYIDTCDQKDELRPWFLNSQSEVLELLAVEEGRVRSVKKKREVDISSFFSSSGLRRRRKKGDGDSSSEKDLPDVSKTPSDPLEQVSTVYKCKPRPQATPNSLMLHILFVCV